MPKLNKSYIDSLKPEKNKNGDYKEVVYFDSLVKGFCVRVAVSGSKTLYLYYRFAGRQRRYKIGRWGDILIKEARDTAEDLRTKIRAGIDPFIEKRKRVVESGISLRRFLDDAYFPYIEAHHKSEYRTKRILEHNFKGAMKLSLSEIDKHYLDEWRTEKLKAKLSASTLNRAVSCLKATLGKASSWGYIESNPLEGMSRLRVDSKGIVRHLSPDEESRLLIALDEYKGVDYIKTFVILLLNTGARPNEAKQLKWSDIGSDLITLQAGYTKTGQTRYIPINKKLAGELQRWKKLSDSEYLFSGSNGHIVSVQKPWNKVIKLSKIKNFRLYDLRHTFASNLMMKGASIYDVGELLGHTDTKTTQIYAHLSPDHKKSVVNLL